MGNSHVRRYEDEDKAKYLPNDIFTKVDSYKMQNTISETLSFLEKFI